MAQPKRAPEIKMDERIVVPVTKIFKKKYEEYVFSITGKSRAVSDHVRQWMEAEIGLAEASKETVDDAQPRAFAGD